MEKHHTGQKSQGQIQGGLGGQCPAPLLGENNDLFEHFSNKISYHNSFIITKLFKNLSMCPPPPSLPYMHNIKISGFVPETNSNTQTTYNLGTMLPAY